MAKYFITGITGYIGNKLAHELLSKGHTLHAIVRNPDRLKNFENHQELKVFPGHLTDTSLIEKAMMGCDFVFHLAAYATVWSKTNTEFESINVQVPLLIAQIATKLGLKRMVLTGTAGVYGPSTHGVVNEDYQRSLPFFNEYEKSKSQGEEILLKNKDKLLEIIIVSPTRVYGPGPLSESNAVSKLIKMYIQNKWRIIPGKGDKIGNYVFVDDVVKGHLLAMEKGVSGEKYILGGENLSYFDFFKLLKTISGKGEKPIEFPLAALLFLGWIQLFWAELTGKNPLFTPPWVRRYMYNWEISISKAKKDLQYIPTDAKVSLKTTIDWINNGN
ncbi:MAG: nucleoside-diphosphate-sugar epimerase [Sphingobacteriales bacterium]|jgi:nucleoside-diphosphate-sugar epimerase